MTLFAIACALLLAITLLALLRPLLRRAAPPASAADESRSALALLREQLAELDAERAAGTLSDEQHALARSDLERRVLEEAGGPRALPQPAHRTVAAALVIALALPVLAVGLYARLGNPAALDPQARAAPDIGGVTVADVGAMVDKLAQRMEAQPDDPDGWAILARSYVALQRLPDALRAFARAVALRPDDAQLLADYADVLGAQNNQSLAGEPTRLIERALKADPGNLKALALAGSAAYERGDTRVAIGYWQRAREQVPGGSEFAAGLDASLAEAQSRLGASAGPTAAAAVPTPPTTQPTTAPITAPGDAAGATLRGRVSLSPALAAQVQPGDTVFVFARPAEGPRMPLAIVRRSASELPFEFTLDDSTAMAPGMQLSRFPQVVVVARVSRSGQATPQTGDLTGQSAVLAPGGGGAITITIDQRQP